MSVKSTEITHSDDKGIELSLFQGLKSVVRHKDYERVDVGQDNLFWAIKLYTEDLIRNYGEHKEVAYSLIESFAFSRFVDRAKDKSTLKAKCRSIWNWYNERDWTIPKRYERDRKTYYEDTKMTRSEHMKNVKKEEARRNRANVINLITGLMSEEYKKKSGAWHYGKIAEAVKLTSKTVAKIVKEYKNECS